MVNFLAIVLSSLAVVDAFAFPSSLADVSSSVKDAIASAPKVFARKGGSTCPAIWTTISSELTKVFLGSDGQCTDLARAAIRFSFHDAGKIASSQVDHSYSHP